VENLHWTGLSNECMDEAMYDSTEYTTDNECIELIYCMFKIYCFGP